MKSYNNFITSEEYIKIKCREFGIYNYTISDGVIDVRGDVDLSDKGLSRLPIRFGTINGNFDISINVLVSLEGCPKEVLGYFMCDNNELISLEGGPNLVLGEYDCYQNKLTSLKGGPKFVGENFNCNINELVSLEYSPIEVGGYFNCSHNKLVNLLGCTKKIGDGIYCFNNELISLEGTPSPDGHQGVLYFDNNKLKDLKGFPDGFVDISVEGNPVEEVFNLFPRERWLEVVEFLNEYDVIRDGKKLVMQALEVVYDELGLEVPDEIYIKGYEII